MIKNINPMVMPGIATIEDIAASIWDIDPEKLNEKTRKREVVEARQVLMVFRSENLKQSLSESADPYGKDHATVVYSKKTISNLRKTNAFFLRKHDLFLSIATKFYT